MYDDDTAEGIADSFVRKVSSRHRGTGVLKTVVKHGLHVLGYDELYRIVVKYNDDAIAMQSHILECITQFVNADSANAHYAYAELTRAGIVNDDDPLALYNRACSHWLRAAQKHHKQAVNRCKLWVIPNRERCQRKSCADIFWTNSPFSFGFFCSKTCHQCHLMNNRKENLQPPGPTERKRERILDIVDELLSHIRSEHRDVYDEMSRTLGEEQCKRTKATSFASLTRVLRPHTKNDETALWALVNNPWIYEKHATREHTREKREKRERCEWVKKYICTDHCVAYEYVALHIHPQFLRHVRTKD